MKKKRIEAMPPKNRTGKTGYGYAGTAQMLGECLIVNVYTGEKLVGRYCMHTQTNEYACIAGGIWHQKKIMTLLGCDPIYDTIGEAEKNFYWESMADEAIAEAELGTGAGSVLREIGRRETDYSTDVRERAKVNRYRRIEDMMDTVPEIPEGLGDWVYECIFRDRYLFWDGEDKRYGCSNCGYSLPEKEWETETGKKKIKHNETVMCPNCGEMLTIKKWRKRIVQKDRVILMQPWDEERSVVRHFEVECEYGFEGHRILLDERVRLTPMVKPHRKDCEIYYEQPETYAWWDLGRPLWYTSNPGNRRMRAGWLYPEGIREALEGTAYEGMIRGFESMARTGGRYEYNAAMAAGVKYRGLGSTLEYLCKGRFYRLLRETTEKCDVFWGGGYHGCLYLNGDTAQEVFGIWDRQLINRIRQQDGGDDMTRWMQFADGDGRKISQETLDWLISNGIGIKDINDIGPYKFVIGKMSLERIRNYVTSQQREKESAKDVLGRWGDYLTMLTAAGKKIDEELIYRPKDLKRRHDEVIEDRRKLEAVKRMMEDPKKREEEALEMEKKFPEAAGILAEVKTKYEYASGEYCMVMPERLVEIVREGYALHHCGGSSDRYFNRICNRETYIGFCRRVSEPQIPYYTIEFEPNGTIRQSRTYYDEETGIEAIREFLKEWQREIRKRLTKEDQELQAKSAELREKNLEELRQKHNTFVLKKLEEDFMEAG